jgi:hypothetical protein
MDMRLGPHSGRRPDGIGFMSPSQAYYSADSGRRDIWKDEALSNAVTIDIK